MKWRFGSLGLLLAFALLAGVGALKGQAQQKGYSHARIVRLSFVDGTVLVKRPGVQQWSKASVNTPIEQGFSISTPANSFAEVEFENGSTARLGQLSRLNFTTLALTPKGDKISDLTFVQGYGTFHLDPQHGNVYTVQAADSTITPRGKTEFRTDLTQRRLRIQVFSGSVDVKDPKQSVKLTKNKTLETSPQALTAFNISPGIQKDSWDDWVQKRDVQTEMAFNDSPVSADSSLYGWSDLDEYGEWGFFPGYGYGWSPFAPMGWAPFSMGQWSWYPGMGYTWISSEPWGWLPFHYGYWNFSPGFGYFWAPGNMAAWNPGSVAWYRGGAYVGWSAVGRNGAPVCSTAACVTSVRAGTLQNGLPVDANTRFYLNRGELARVSSPGVLLSPLGMLPGPPASRMNVRNTAVSSLAAHGAAAPNIILMGQKPVTGSTSHRSFFRGEAGPLRARLGNTLGGRYTAFTSARAGSPLLNNINSRFAGSSRPVFLDHRGGSWSQPAVRFEGGRIHAVSRSFAAPGTGSGRGSGGMAASASRGGGMARGARGASGGSGGHH